MDPKDKIARENMESIAKANAFMMNDRINEVVTDGSSTATQLKCRARRIQWSSSGIF